ncbi:MAG: glycosyltransferase family A protein [Candidatus Binatia bacterium]
MDRTESPLVSCIIPVYNGELYLREAIDSILAQTYRPVEIIVADDGSTDGTADIIAEFGEPVHCLRQTNQGPAASRNLGARAATGDFIAFLDADDLWHPDKLERQMVRFQIRPELDYCVTYSQNFWVPELKQEAERFAGHRIARPMPGYVTGTLLGRRVVFDKVGPFNTALGHGDSTEWFLRAAERGAVMELLPDVLMYRRLHPANRSRLRAADSRNQFLDILKGSLDRRRREPSKAASNGDED